MRQGINEAMAKAEEKRAVEIIAVFLHSAWMDWAGTILEQEPISEERAQRWVKYMVPYKDLPEDAKDKDRAYAKELLAALLDYWLPPGLLAPVASNYSVH